MTTENTVKTPQSIIATLELQETQQKDKVLLLPPLEPTQPKVFPKRNQPLKNDWQRKWLDLEVYDPRLQDIADAVQNYAARLMRWNNSKPLLIIFGPPGNGKTRIASHLHSWATRMALTIFDANRMGMSHLPSVTWRSWPRVVDGFKEGRYEIMNDLLNDDIIFVDDLGAEHDPSKNGVDKLCQLLSHRERKFSVITTNLSPEEWENKWDARVADRLLRRSQAIDMTEIPSYSVFVATEGVANAAGV